ncbi:MAG TPA: hypothetical protein VN408_42445 [Actinoplanes sp.]|nr:hypothetical protein [Actinoplanes sp.]
MSSRGRLLAATSLSALLCAVGCDALSGEPTPGDDVLLGDTAYGWATSQDVGTRFSNGLTVVPIGKGPLTIEKIEPVIEGEALHLLGVKARVQPTTVDEGPYQLMSGWPPSPIEPGDDVYVRGLTEPAGLKVPVPNV